MRWSASTTELSKCNLGNCYTPTAKYATLVTGIRDDLDQTVASFDDEDFVAVFRDIGDDPAAGVEE